VAEVGAARGDVGVVEDLDLFRERHAPGIGDHRLGELIDDAASRERLLAEAEQAARVVAEPVAINAG